MTKRGAMKAKWLIIAVLGSVMAMAACTKKRPVRPADGAAEYMNEISEFDGKRLQMKTHESLEANDLTKAENIKIGKDNIEFRRFPRVSYSGSTELMELLGENLVVRGRPNFQYEIMLKIEGEHLKVYKLSKAEDMHYLERSYAHRMMDDKLLDKEQHSSQCQSQSDKCKSVVYAVPLVGYPIKGYFNLVRRRNSDNEETNELREKWMPTVDGAKYFRFSPLGKTIFDSVSMVDAYPISYFNKDKWYFAVTVIEASGKAKQNLGSLRGYDEKFNLSALVKLKVEGDQLRAVNANMDNRLDQKSDVNNDTAIRIPFERKSYQLNKKDGLSVVENADRDSEKSGDLISLEFLKTWTIQDLVDSGGNKLDFKKLTDLQFDKGYFSFTLYDNVNEIRVKYSFLRAPDEISESASYKPRRVFYDDQKRFGYFYSKRHKVGNREKTRLEDHEKNLFINRFDPNKEIVYHFSKSEREQWVSSAVEQSVKMWNKGFALAGVKARVRLDTDKDVDLGDIRYNVINIIDGPEGTPLNGMGPSLADPRTGEVMAATTNIHLATLRENTIRLIQNYISRKIGVLDKSAKELEYHLLDRNSVTPSFSDAIRSGFGVGDALEWVDGKVGQLQVPMSLPSSAGEYEWVTHSDIVQKLESKTREFPGARVAEGAGRSQLDVRGFGAHEDYASSLFVAGSVLDASIARLCPEVEAFVKGNVGARVSSEQEMLVAKPCYKKVVLPKLKQLVLHEMGHNFGLRHNFRGSTDSDNFWTAQQIEKYFDLPIKEESAPVTSSVMDYFPLEVSLSMVPGRYDVAAIRFGYRGWVEADAGMTRVDPKYSIDANMKSLGRSVRQYANCSDGDFRLKIDPMCLKHDNGTTPLEVTKWLAANYLRAIVFGNFRYDKDALVGQVKLASWHLKHFLLPMNRLYGEWRKKLTRAIGVNNQYLDDFGKARYVDLLGQLKQDHATDAEFMQYMKVRDYIQNFLLSIVQTPDHMCIGANGSGELGVVEFSVVKNLMEFDSSTSALSSCGQPEVVQFLKSSKYGLDYVGEVGLSFEAMRYDSSKPVSDNFPLDEAGFASEKALAFYLMASRIGQRSAKGKSVDFFPSMLDEPDFRERTINYLQLRIGTGVDLYSFLEDRPEFQSYINHQSPVFRRFSTEANLLKKFYRQLLRGLKVPGRLETSMDRLAAFQIDMTNNLNVAERAALSIPTPGGKYLMVKDPGANRVAYFFGQKYQYLRDQRHLPEVDEAKFSAIVESIIAQLPSDPSVPFSGEDYMNSVVKNVGNQLVKAGINPGVEMAGELFLDRHSAVLNAEEERLKRVKVRRRGQPKDALVQSAHDSLLTRDVQLLFEEEGLPRLDQNVARQSLEKILREVRQAKRADQEELLAQRSLLIDILFDGGF